VDKSEDIVNVLFIDPFSYKSIKVIVRFKMGFTPSSVGVIITSFLQKEKSRNKPVPWIPDHSKFEIIPEFIRGENNLKKIDGSMKSTEFPP